MEGKERRGHGAARSGTAVAAWLLVCTALAGLQPGRALAAQTLGDKQLYFGDAHWHSCLSQDAPRETSLTAQYESMLYDYGLDFSLQSDHSEGVTAGITSCMPYLPPVWSLLSPSQPSVPIPYSGEQIANAMKQAADDWYGVEHTTSAGPIRFVTFPGYEWAPDARCWQASPLDPFPNDLNADDDTPGHINYFFSDTTGWTYHDDVWEPGDGDSDTCATASALGLTYYTGSKDWVDEILAQLIHQRDDPARSYDLLIQYNHPAASIDKAGTSDHLAKWYDFEHSSGVCDVTPGGTSCTQNQCEAMRRAYGVSTVEWYAIQEASIGSTLLHGGDGPTCTGIPIVDAVLPRCFHDTYHLPERYVTSRGLREGYMLAETGGSDSHSGRRFDPNGFPGSRGAGSKSLTVVQASAPTRQAIWDGLTRRRTYGLSRLREIGPVHKGRVDFFTPDPVGNQQAATALPPGGVGGIVPSYGMGEIVEAVAAGTARDFTVSAAAEIGTTGVYPVEIRLYRVNRDTPLSAATDVPYWWLDDVPGDPGKLGELLGTFVNPNGATSLTHTFANVVVHPGDAVFAVIPYSDYVWADDFYDGDRNPLDADHDGEPDPGKSGFLHNNDNTWARTTPIFFRAAEERPRVTPACASVTFNGSGSESPMAAGGVDAGFAGDGGVLPVAIPGGYDREWNRWHFSLPADYAYVDLSFLTASDEDDIGHLFAVRIDGRLVYSGRAGIDHDADALVDMKNIPFALEKGLHLLEVHMDDQEFADGDNDPDFHCNDYDGPPAFVDAVAFHAAPDAACGDVTPPVITCPASIGRECSAPGGVPASDASIAAFLSGATATDDYDPTPTITSDAPAFFPTGTTTVRFTATDDAGNAASCTATVTVADTTPPVLAPFALSPATLAPPNHKLRPITAPTLVATDVCDAAPKIRCAVDSSEAPNGSGDGDTPIDIVLDGQQIATQGTGERAITTPGGSGTFTLQLRAERAGRGGGRTYTASCAPLDASGNRGSTRTSVVSVR